ncbi:MAG: hypothetical protein JNN00_19465 [Chitinophagaceae bacterium]|nr:hypothetical protein [Chitinophagaceae bacterium]
MTTFKEIMSPIDTKEKAYFRYAASSVGWDDFIRIIYELEKDGYLLKSEGPNGEVQYFLLNNVVNTKKVWYKTTEIWIKILGVIAGLLALLKVVLG